MIDFLRLSPVFSRYLLAVASAALGDALIFIALPFLVLGLSDSPQTLATVVVLGSLPRFFGPLIGNLADRVALRRPLVAAGLLRAALFGLLAGLALAGALPIALIYVAAPLNGLLTIFVFSASNVVVPQLVSEQQLEQANSLLQGAIMGIPLLGFAVGGTLVATLGSALTVALAVPCFVGLSAVIRTLPLPRRAASGVTSFVADLAAGAKILTSQTTFVVLLGLSLVLNAALSGLNVAVPLTMRDLGLGARGFGLFEMTLSVGMLGGIVAVGLLRTRVSLGGQVGGSSRPQSAYTRTPAIVMSITRNPSSDTPKSSSVNPAPPGTRPHTRPTSAGRIPPRQNSSPTITSRKIRFAVSVLSHGHSGRNARLRKMVRATWTNITASRSGRSA